MKHLLPFTKWLLMMLLVVGGLSFAAQATYGQSSGAQTAPELNLTLGEQRVRFAPTRSFQEMRLEVVNSVGEIVFTHTTTEAEFDWNLRAGNSEALAPGLYRYTLSLKFAADQARQHTGHFIVEKGQDQVWLTASEGTEVSGTVLSASRSGGRSITGLGSKDDKSIKRDVSGREIVNEKGDDQGDKLTGSTKAVKAALLGTANMVPKYDVGGVNLIDSAITEVGGNVGIGTTAPTSILEMVRPTVSDVVFKMQNATRAWSVGVSGTGDFWRIRDNTAGAARLTVLGGSGNVGIGNSNPLARLDVTGVIRVRGNGDILGEANLSPHTGPGDFIVYAGVPGTGIRRMTVKNDGRVGIGTATPLMMLDVRATPTTPSPTAIQGISSATNGTGVYGEADTGSTAVGVYGSSINGTGVDGWSNSSDSTAAAVRAESFSLTGNALRIVRGRINVRNAGINTNTPVFIHQVTAANTPITASIIDHPLCNDNPNAILIVTLNTAPGGVDTAVETRTVQVFYSIGNNRWHIAPTTSLATKILVNSHWNILVVNP